MHNHGPNYDYHEHNFNGFVSFLQGKINDNFLVDENKYFNSKRNRLFNPWITNGIIASVQRKTYFYDQWKKSCRDDNKLGNEELYMRYKNFRFELRKIIKLAKKTFYFKKFESVQGNMKKTWKLINDLRGKPKNNIKASFIINGEMVQDRRVIAKEFNIFFSSIARNLNTKVYSSTLPNGQKEPGDKFSTFLDPKKRSCNSFFMSPCTKDEVTDIVRELENGKASDIPISLMKKTSSTLLDPLSKFFNYFLIHGIFPSILKKASVTPVFKKGDSRFLDNYRPVSTLPLFGKILEKLIYNRLHSFFTANNTIYENQYGFRKNHSTSHAVNLSVKQIIDQIEKKRHVIGIFIDLSKAFDTISHEKLIYKLNFYGLRGLSLKLIKSYLSGRTQTTKFQSENSDESNIEYGVPQGSVLGPLLFLIYVNDIVMSSDLGKFVLYADDTNIFVSGNSEAEAYEKAQSVLNAVYDYMYANQLHINVEKSCYMHFRHEYSNKERLVCARTDRTYDRLLSLKLCDKKLKKVSKVKFLGVIIDEKLKWEAHIEHLQKKLKLSIIMIKRVKKFIPKKEYLKLYNALFTPHLTYCISVWGGISDYKLSKIFTLQKRCIRLLFGTELTFDHPEYYMTCARARTYTEHTAPKNFLLEHTKPLFNENGFLSLRNLYKYFTLLELFKILKYKSPIPITELFTLSNQDYKIYLLLPKFNLDIGLQSFVFSASRLWNQYAKFMFEICSPDMSGIVIPGSVKNSDLSASASVIKSKIKKILLDEQKSGCEITW